MAKALLVLALIAGAVSGAGFAGSTSAQLTVGVTVVRSCAIDARPTGKASALLHLTCTAGAHSTLKVTEAVHGFATVISDGSTILTLNF